MDPFLTFQNKSNYYIKNNSGIFTKNAKAIQLSTIQLFGKVFSHQRYLSKSTELKAVARTANLREDKVMNYYIHVQSHILFIVWYYDL